MRTYGLSIRLQTDRMERIRNLLGKNGSSFIIESNLYREMTKPFVFFKKKQKKEESRVGNLKRTGPCPSLQDSQQTNNICSIMLMLPFWPRGANFTAQSDRFVSFPPFFPQTIELCSQPPRHYLGFNLQPCRYLNWFDSITSPLRTLECCVKCKYNRT